MDERLEKTEGWDKRGKEIEEEAKKRAEEYEDKLKEARARALEIRDSLKKDGLEEEKKIIREVVKEAKGLIEEKKEEVCRTVEQVKGELEKKMDEDSHAIAERVLGRRME